MTPRRANQAIKQGLEILVRTPLEDAPFHVHLVGQDRWNVFTADGQVFDRGDLLEVDKDESNHRKD